jgi:alpha-tubulin suppressor-like RCC1 family protein
VPAAAKSGVVAIAAGFAHSLALKDDGSVVAWGCRGPADSAPCQVPARAANGVLAIAAGVGYGLAIESG